MEKKKVLKPKRPKPKSQRSATFKREKKLAKVWGGKRVVLSGVSRDLLGDVMSIGFMDNLLIDSKMRTSAEGRCTVEYKWVKKIQDEAEAMGKKLGLLVFQAKYGKKKYVVCDEQKFRVYWQGVDIMVESLRSFIKEDI